MDCTRFHKNGKYIRKGRDNQNRKPYGVNAHIAEESVMSQCFAQMHNNQKKVIKLLEKAQFSKKKKRKRVVYMSPIPQTIPTEMLGRTILVLLNQKR